MSPPTQDIDRPRRAWLPYETVTTRILWSIPALALIAYWKYWMIAAEVVPFYPKISHRDVCALVLDALPGMLLPTSGVQFPVFYHALPWMALAAWCLLLVPWRSRAVRIVVTAAAVMPAAMGMLANPLITVISAVVYVFLPAMSIDGESLEFVPYAFPAWWVVFITPVLLLQVVRRTQPGRCAECGYSLEGLAGLVCPECGAACSPALPGRGLRSSSD